MNPKKARMLTLCNEICATDVGGKHGLFDYPVCHVAGTGHNLFNPPVFIANYLSLGSFKINRAPLLSGLDQCLVNTVQVLQVSNTVFATHSLWSACVAKNCRHFGIGETRMAPHHGRIKLIGLHLAISRYKHVAHHA